MDRNAQKNLQKIGEERSILQANLSEAVTVICLLFVIIILFFLAILVIKSRNLWLERKTNVYAGQFQDYFTYIQSHMDSPERLNPPYWQLNRLELRVLQQKLIEWIESLTGSHQKKIIALCEDTGLVNQNIQRLYSRFHWIRIDAAYHVGAMRSGEAVPRLLQLLHTKKLDPTHFIIARSISKCARNLDDVRNMLFLLVKHRKSNCHLVVDIMKETELDCTPLLLDCLRSTDKDLIKIALIGWTAPLTAEIADLVYRQIDSRDREVRIQAVKLLFKYDPVLAAEVIESLMKANDTVVCQDAEIVEMYTVNQVRYKKRMNEEEQLNKKNRYVHAV